MYQASSCAYRGVSYNSVSYNSGRNSLLSIARTPNLELLKKIGRFSAHFQNRTKRTPGLSSQQVSSSWHHSFVLVLLVSKLRIGSMYWLRVVVSLLSIGLFLNLRVGYRDCGFGNVVSILILDWL
jgi:hypothetical protein